MNNINPIGFAVFAVAAGFCIYIAVRWFWPLLLVLAAVFLTGWLRTRHTVHESEKYAQDLQKQKTQEELRDKRDRAPVIDAQFTIKEEEKAHD